MAKESSQIDGTLNIYFVVFSKHESEDNCSEDMWEAFSKCQENEMAPQWIQEATCSQLNPTKTDIFVLEEFVGELFKKLETTKCFRIVGPRCLLRCFLTGESVPPGASPVFTTAMKDMVVCASGFNHEIKEDIQKKVEYMGGFYIRHLRNCITHLVTDSVMSAKYEKASQTKIPVFTYEWIKAVWNANLTEFIQANDPSFDKYKCLPFINLIVTSTNLPKRQKEEVKRLINENGGEFMGPLDGTKVKVVVAPNCSVMSDKLKFAMQNNIPCLRTEWVSKSVKAGYALPFHEYLISPTSKAMESSTPEKGSTQINPTSLDLSRISNFPTVNNQNFVEESMSSTIASHVDSRVERNSAPYVLVVDRLDIRGAKIAGPFLDGCSIYVTGFQTQHRDKINKILNVGSATRFDDISDALTHVLVGDIGKASNELKIIQSKGINPHILNINWLEESIKLKKPAPEESYAIDVEKESISVKTIEPQSPLSKRSIQMLQKPKRPPVPQFDIDKQQSTLPDDDEPDIVQQYLQKSNINTPVQVENQSINCSSSRKDSNTTCLQSKYSQTMSKVQNHQQTIDREPANESEVPLSQSTMNEHIFDGLTFLVMGFDEEENSLIIANITGLGGQLVSSSFTGIPDYGVVPLIGAQLRHTVNEIVTNLFVEDCIDNDKVVDIVYYHRPLSLPDNAKPLINCVIAMSSYAGVERIYLAKLSVALGALHQDAFSRRTNIEKGQYAGTHLVCTSPTGNKYNAAVKWNLPAVTAEWLLACAEKLELVDETPYLVGETVAPVRENNLNSLTMCPPPIPTPRKILTPKRNLLQTPEIETPVINKRLSSIQNNTLNSPFHVATPESPYGQIFKPNPSPDTRKCWAKWIDNFPDKIEPPAKRRRAPSTPLSELKRQIWSAMKKPIGEDTSQHNDDESSWDNHNASVNKDDKNTDNSDVPINRVLSFMEENNSLSKSPLNEQLEQMDKILRTTNSTEIRYSLIGDNAKIHEEPRDHINDYIMPPTQPESVCWEDPKRISKNTQDKISRDIIEESPAESAPPRKRKFMLSGLRDRSAYEEIIKQLGGEVSSDPNFDDTATHLLCVRPSRNEKMLGSIAAGKWVLHCSYLRDCERANEFIDEEKYEWGNPRSKDIIPNVDVEQEKVLAAAAYRWRIKLRASTKYAFDGMVAMLMVSKDKYEPVERLILAGGGTVVQAKPPYDTSPNGKKITHCFIQMNKIEQPIDWAMLASKGIWCHLPQYLSQHLTAVEPINPRDCVIPEFKKYLTLMPKL